jgi:hypothetical protein
MRVTGRFVWVLGIALLGCEAKTIIDPPSPPGTSTLETKQFTTGSTNDRWVYFSFSNADTAAIISPSASQDWDIAFYRTAIKINCGTSGPGKGGATMITSVDFDNIKRVPASAGFAVDDTLNTLGSAYAIPGGSDEGWYHYTGDPNHWIVAIPDRVFIFRTAAEKYAKVRFISYYSNGQPPSQPLQTDSGFYTFKFVYQSDGSMQFE